MEKLKPKEQMVYDYIARSVRERGFSPSVRDICRDLGYKSTSTVHMYLNRLALFGYITKEDGKSRTITLSSEAPRVCTLHTYLLSDVNERGYGAEPVSCTSIVGEYDSERLFAFVAEDDNLKDYGIVRGDTLVFECTVYAEDGEIVLLREDKLLSIKHFWRDGGKYVTEDAETRRRTDEADIVGRLLSLSRTFAKGTR